ncbi:hypothetical protein IC608_17795 [Devosia sp. PTR5]|uniref:Lipoprotein n=1 Tax=Devosia oryzisoli TaxID=2774138 RepID=A0A927FXF5_9HYPH|nr:hypothetical protein [Devosia oryzisoli]MBD8067327.1 hypothetical protein [Devosia oryzisoli]
MGRLFALTFVLMFITLAGCSRAPKPQSPFGKAVYEAMLRYEASPGIFDISDEICGTFNEEDVAVAVEEMPELDPLMSVGGIGPTPGSTSATFRRSVGWPWTQTLFIDVKSDEGYCSAQIGRRST